MVKTVRPSMYFGGATFGRVGIATSDKNRPVFTLFFLFRIHPFGVMLVGIRFQTSEVTGNQWKTL
jgi:hypothetical protein